MRKGGPSTLFRTARTRRYSSGLSTNSGADLAERVVGDLGDALLAHGGVIVEGPHAKAFELGEVLGVDLSGPVLTC